jgi:NAD(P)-dependent dehydrogenase (short-subunit alcohol dehydrogenase family)
VINVFNLIFLKIYKQVNRADQNGHHCLQNTFSRLYILKTPRIYKAPMQILQACLPAMTRKGYGRVVNISSRAALGMIKRTAYAGAKSGIVGMTKTWALELGPRGITVNAIAPGPIATELYKKNNPMTPDQEQKVIARIPVRRIGTPEDVANAIEFFLSPASGFITGQVLYTCGGLSVGAASS